MGRGDAQSHLPSHCHKVFEMSRAENSSRSEVPPAELKVSFRQACCISTRGGRRADRTTFSLRTGMALNEGSWLGHHRKCGQPRNPVYLLILVGAIHQPDTHDSNDGIEGMGKTEIPTVSFPFNHCLHISKTKQRAVYTQMGSIYTKQECVLSAIPYTYSMFLYLYLKLALLNRKMIDKIHAPNLKGPLFSLRTTLKSR